jgi:hypothetical protein
VVSGSGGVDITDAVVLVAVGDLLDVVPALTERRIRTVVD